MKKLLFVLITVFLLAGLMSACTPGTLVDTLNGLGGATPGNGLNLFATPGSAMNGATPGNAALGLTVVATAGNAQ